MTLIPVLSLSAQTPGGVSSPLLWSATSSIDSIRVKNSSGFTFIGISKTTSDHEHTLWSLSDGKSSEILQTTSRSADLGSGFFMNCTPDSGKTRQLYSYSTSKNVGGRSLHIGKSYKKSLPSANVSNALVEYAVYDRSLSSLERAQVESYMALKHGITLKTSYYDSRGRMIWNKTRNNRYQNRISGIIADQASAQYILSASSSEDGSFARITAENLEDGQSLLFGDDGGRLAFSRSVTYGKWMGRRWRTTSTGMTDTQITLAASTTDIQQIQPLDESESYYLAIDTTGMDSFRSDAVLYVKATPAIGDSISFCNINAAGNWAFTLRAEKDLFTTIDVKQPEIQGGTGMLNLLVTGGISPYTMRLEKEGILTASKTEDAQTVVFTDLQEGTYKLTTADHTGNMAINEFRISSDRQTEILPSLSTSKEDNFTINVWPNPTTDGYVKVQIEQDAAKPVAVTLHTVGGAMESTQSLPADTYYCKQIYLPQSGNYLLNVKSEEGTKTVKLIRR